jgi:hypothetical protein
MSEIDGKGMSHSVLEAASRNSARGAELPVRLPMKIFQIGFNKCGTSTIHHYLRSNGVSSVHWDRGRLAQRIFANLAEGLDLLAGYEQFDAFTDMEYLDHAGTYLEGYKLFPYLAAQYPGAVFILNTRDREDWIRSRLAHGKSSYARRHMDYHRVRTAEELATIWRADWERHHRRVVEFFRGKPYRFFVCRIETDLPHMLNAQLGECKLDPTHYEIRKSRSPASGMGGGRGQTWKNRAKSVISRFAPRSSLW